MINRLKYKSNKFELNISRFISRRAYSTDNIDPYTDKVNKARFDCIEQLKKVDPSSLLLSKFYPEYLRDSYIAFKSFNIELSKISFAFQPGATNKSKEFNNLKFSFWLQQLEKCDSLNINNASNLIPDINEPCLILLSDILLKNLKFDLDNLKQMIHSHKHFYNENSTQGFRNLNEMCSFGEGTHSQINYLMQSVLLSPQLTGFSNLGIDILQLPNSNNLRNTLTDISAHLGQSTSIGSFIIGLKYFAQKKQTLMLPTDSLIKYRLPEENCLRFLQNDTTLINDTEIKESLKNIIFDIATVANDHIITARSKLNDAKDLMLQLAIDNNRSDLVKLINKNKKMPDCFYLPYLNGLPTILYLEKLEKYDFDITNKNLITKEWRLAFRAWNNERNRTI